ncbi:MAG: response regulator transcription factor [Bacteroidetes bacterium]|nr:response regulator transcription factor [Bacteroidota bacterium]MDA1335936.1 response regulator transcription factor [Bacteroidota bacterium]
MSTHVLIADSSPVFRYGLDEILSKKEGFHVTAHAGSGEELEAILKEPKNQCDLVIIDCLSTGFGVDNILSSLRLRPNIKMLAITSSHSGQSIVNSLRAGITSYVKKDCSMEEVIQAIEETSKGGTFFCGQILAAIEAESIEVDDLELANANCDPILLTEREIEVLTLISEGLTNVQIADKLFLSNHTVNTHRKNIMQKLGVKNTASMVMFAVKSGFVSPNRFLFQNS